MPHGSIYGQKSDGFNMFAWPIFFGICRTCAKSCEACSPRAIPMLGARGSPKWLDRKVQALWGLLHPKIQRNFLLESWWILKISLFLHLFEFATTPLPGWYCSTCSNICSICWELSANLIHVCSFEKRFVFFGFSGKALKLGRWRVWFSESSGILNISYSARCLCNYVSQLDRSYNHALRLI